MVLLTAIAIVSAQGPAIEGRLLRFPDIHGDQVVFSYAGDLWTASASGGIARKLTNDAGPEVRAKFSPDGKWLAFTATYEGNADIYVMPSVGGEPKRLTYHPGADTMVDWTPDGTAILFRSARESVTQRYTKLFTIPATGGTPTSLPMDEAGQASASPDGKTFAYVRMSTENAAWKRYRGGNQSFISFYDTVNHRYWEMDKDKSASMWPMWVGDTVYYVNDGDGVYNLYAYDTQSKKSRKLTNFNDYDVKFPSEGTGAIVFERDARLWRFDLKSNQTIPIPITVFTDHVRARPRRAEVGNEVSDATISPSGTRVALEAHGEIFSVPAKEGLTYNATKSAGVRDRFPRWSPDGKWILFLSDKTGEYEFYKQKSDLSEPPIQLTFGAKIGYNAATWSPDSKRAFFMDIGNTLYVLDVEAKTVTTVGSAEWGGYQDAVWSPDSKWLAYSKANSEGLGQIYLYNVDTREETLVSDGLFQDQTPMFDAEGKYLFFSSARDFNPAIGTFELSFIFRDAFRIYGYTLRPDVASPFAPKNEVEKIADEAPKTDPSGGQGGDSKQAASWDLKFDRGRMFSLPLPPGDYSLAASAPGRLFYMSGPALFQFDFAAKQAAPILEGFQAGEFTPKRDKFVYIAGPVVGVIPVAPGQKVGNGRVNTGDMETTIDPRAEWKQSFWDAWRYERDNFWAPTMNGIDWKAMGDKYAGWLPWLGDRSDLDYLLTELLGELATGHSYVMPGPTPGNPPIGTGLLGADYDRTRSGIRFKKVFRGQNWDSGRRAPLNEPGMNVQDGDYIVAIDGEPVGPTSDIDQMLVGKADKVVEIAVNSKPGLEGSRKLLVQPIASEAGLRTADWIDSRREYVERKSNGRIGYVYVPDTQFSGIIEFYKMLYAQWDKDALIVDERYNGGGFIPTFFIEMLQRQNMAWWKPRYGSSFRTPSPAVLGPKAMLINPYGGSGGDAFPYFFRKAGLGKVIGMRTWGGLVGITGSYPLMSGGGVTAPEFAVWDVVDGKPQWVVENIGVAPDIEVDNRPDLVYKGQDPQLDKAIEVLLDELRRNPVKRPNHPPFRGGGG